MFFRLWCIVELVAAIVLKVPIVVKGGSVTSSHGIYEYDTKCIGSLMNNLMYMIDVDASECADQLHLKVKNYRWNRRKQALKYHCLTVVHLFHLQS